LAYLRIVRPPTVTAEVYDAVLEKVGVAARHPLGLIMHAAAEVNGCWQVVEVWYGEEYARRFDLDRLMPAFEAVTGSPPPRDAPTVGYELHELIVT
jgi:hypothetical protein